MGTWIEPYIKSTFDPEPFLEFLRERLPIALPPPQVNSDWDTTDPSLPSYIKNKPSIIEVTSLIRNEIPTGLINGSNAIFFTASNFIPESVEVWILGLKLSLPDDYNTSGTTQITFAVSPQIGDKIKVNYQKP